MQEDGHRYFHTCSPEPWVEVRRGNAVLVVPPAAVRPTDVALGTVYRPRPGHRDENVIPEPGAEGRPRLPGPGAEEVTE